MVFSGLVTAWRFAGWPTSRSPSSVKATIDGVVRMPSEFSMTFGFLPSMTATHEFVVPRSIPMTFPMVLMSFSLQQVGRALTAPRSKTPLDQILAILLRYASYRRRRSACKDRAATLPKERTDEKARQAAKERP